MSLHEYQESQCISARDYPFYALIMAAFRKADTDNLGKLRCAFPLTWLEFIKRYNAPGGLLEGEQFDKPQEYPEVPETIMGIEVKTVEARPDWPSTIVLGSFNDYDPRSEDERHQGMQKVFEHTYGPEQEDPSGT